MTRMAGEILYFLHRHFRRFLALGLFASVGLLGAIGVNVALRLLHAGL